MLCYAMLCYATLYYTILYYTILYSNLNYNMLYCKANEQLLEGCTPVLEFIRYMMVREPQRRPSIAAAVKKFEAATAEALGGA